MSKTTDLTIQQTRAIKTLVDYVERFNKKDEDKVAAEAAVVLQNLLDELCGTCEGTGVVVQNPGYCGGCERCGSIEEKEVPCPDCV